MIHNKKKISNYFDIASNYYEKVAIVQKQSAELLVANLLEFDQGFYPNTILDLGTGTGYVPEMLRKHYPKSSFLLNDIAPKMLDKTMEKLGGVENIRFCVGDMEKLIFEKHDLIISNLAFQWADDLFGMIEKIYNKSNVLAFSCLLDGTFLQWQNILSSYGAKSIVDQYPTLDQLVAFCNKISKGKFRFSSKDYHLKFPSAYYFMKYLRHLGARDSENKLSIGTIRSLLQSNSEIEVTYKVFFAHLKNF